MPSAAVEQSLYVILTAGANPGGILWSSVMGRRAEKLYEKLTEWAEEIENEGKRELILLSVAVRDENGVIRFTAFGFDQAVRVIGFQRYPIGMEVHREDSLTPRKLWGDYLAFVILFDIDEQVLKSMEALDPIHHEPLSDMYGYNSYRMIYLMTTTDHISRTAAPNLSGASGIAGSVSGDGFSGGGDDGGR